MEIYAELSEEDIEKIYKRITTNIKTIRLSKKMSQENVALAMGFSTATFYTNAESLKRGKHFNLEHLIRIAHILDVDIKDLFNNKSYTSI